MADSHFRVVVQNPTRHTLIAVAEQMDPITGKWTALEAVRMIDPGEEIPLRLTVGQGVRVFQPISE